MHAWRVLQAWLHQTGFIRTEMAELSIWTSLAALWIVMYHLLGCCSFLFFYYEQEKYRGNPIGLFGLFTAFNHVLLFCFDRLSSSELFKAEAAKMGYPNAVHLHDGFLMGTIIF